MKCGTVSDIMFMYVVFAEAVDIILRFSDSVSLLNRQKVTKNILLQYCVRKKIKWKGRGLKGELCSAILQYWGSPQYADLQFRDREPAERKVKKFSRLM